MTQHVELPCSDENLHDLLPPQAASMDEPGLEAAPEVPAAMNEHSTSGEQATDARDRQGFETPTEEPNLAIATRELNGAQPVQSPKLPSKAKSKAKPAAGSPVPQSPTSPVTIRAASAKHISAPRPKSIALTKQTASTASSEKQSMAKNSDGSAAQTPFTRLQQQAQAALSKGTAALTDASDLAKGNLEAALTSGKILTAGLKDISTAMAADSRGALEAMTGDARKLAAATSPVEFIQLQNSLARKQFEGAISQASKNVEILFKLTSEMMAPLSNQMAITASKIGGSL